MDIFLLSTPFQKRQLDVHLQFKSKQRNTLSIFLLFLYFAVEFERMKKTMEKNVFKSYNLSPTCLWEAFCFQIISMYIIKDTLIYYLL